MLKKRNETKEMKEVLGITARILKLFHIMMIIGIIFFGTLLIKEWGILTFIFTILKIISPFFFGFIIAWLLNPLVTLLYEKGLHRIVGSIIVYSGFLLIIYLFLSNLLPTIYHQLSDFVAIVPNIVERTENIVINLFDNINQSNSFDIETIKGNVIGSIQTYGDSLVESLPTVIMSTVGKIFSGLGTLSLSLILGFYLLFDFETLKSYLLKILPPKYRFEISTLLINVGDELRKCVNGTFFVASIVFVGASIGFIIVGLKSPILFGFFCGLTDIIPYVGPFIGGAIAVIVGFSQGTTTGILALLVVVIVQQLENLVIQPVVMSKSTKINPVIIIVGLLVFGHFFGIIGMLLATPVISISKVLFKFIVEKFGLIIYDEYELVDDELKK